MSSSFGPRLRTYRRSCVLLSCSMSQSKYSDVFRFCPGTRQRNSSSYCVSTGGPCDSKSDSIQNHPGQSEILRSPRKPLKMDISGRSWKLFGQIGGSIPSPCTILILKDLHLSMRVSNNKS